ncbi:sugar (and other) transporter family protein [Bacillus cereus ATCC 4342]|uniref:MFS transporter n=1 Tax=Bacillus tropicus TaxID=2026188 RepID=UPI0001A0173E|nr:MFS transporter [Bacillus tropicus]AJH75225.1 sugar (and other) transporter family protein [Bacillus cereus ATCC 4342]EEK85612.1 Major facilitator superfamily MFS_1 [Bacillus cereus ATCC 4342]KFM85910.1 sugar (and other) transporter family protein [Bacillus cereus ATCC 4342]MDR4453916.1 MFS transporter [Bacillus tropicus]QKH54197.1 MFS transporter [Bacillus tropicus]
MNFNWKNYHSIWLLLLTGWVVSYADRIITGPILTWMIENKISFLQDSSSPYALAGIIGSLLFTGYMLTQFPGGYLGDSYGHRSIIVISLLWAGFTTVLSGLTTTLFGFVALRVIVGLGEGLYYSNDRTLINEVTPIKRRSLGMGIVITGLSIGITLGTLLTPYLINFGEEVLGFEHAWRMPFFLLGILTMIVGVIVYKTFKEQEPNMAILPPLLKVLQYSALFLSIIMIIFYVADYFLLPSWSLAIIELVLAFVLILFALNKKAEKLSPVLLDKNLLLMYFSAIPILWNLWFFGFWSVSIISQSASTSFLEATLTATFNAVAGIIGYPLGGILADYCFKNGWGKKRLILSFTFIQGALTLIFGFYLIYEGKSLVIMGLLLFITSLFFNAIQTISHSMVGELAKPGLKGTAFGMWNLIGEIGAVLSPVINGMLRDITGEWTTAILLDGIIVLFSFVLLLFVRERSAQNSYSSRTVA